MVNECVETGELENAVGGAGREMIVQRARKDGLSKRKKCGEVGAMKRVDNAGQSNVRQEGLGRVERDEW